MSMLVTCLSDCHSCAVNWLFVIQFIYSLQSPTPIICRSVHAKACLLW